MSDKKRLDWLESKGSIEIECDLWDNYSIGDQIDDRYGNDSYRSLRSAIDAAMKAEMQQTKVASAVRQQQTSDTPKK